MNQRYNDATRYKLYRIEILWKKFLQLNEKMEPAKKLKCINEPCFWLNEFSPEQLIRGKPDLKKLDFVLKLIKPRNNDAEPAIQLEVGFINYSISRNCYHFEIPDHPTISHYFFLIENTEFVAGLFNCIVAGDFINLPAPPVLPAKAKPDSLLTKFKFWLKDYKDWLKSILC
ncbi:MAG: hypothetical protein WCW02_02720 [Candidatus Buchananbacteria bacterium]